MSLNASETFRAKLSAGAWVGGSLFDRHTSQIWMMGTSTFGAAFLDFVGAVFPVVALDKTTVTHLVFVDDLPLVIGVGVLQHSAVGSGMVVGATIFRAPSTPQFIWFG